MPQVNPIVRRGLQNAFLELELARKSDTEIMKELGISRETIVSYRKLAPKVRESPTFETMKSVIRMEVSQENALTELSLQMADYSKEYRDADTPEDRQRWGALRLRCLETMIKVTGLDKGLPPAPNAEKNTIIVKWIRTRPDSDSAAVSTAEIAGIDGKPAQSVRLVKV